MKVFGTDIEGLDAILGGGLIRGQSIAITGKPGSGKTVLATQIAFAAATRGEQAVVATLTSESQTKLVGALGGFAFADENRIGKEVFFVSALPALNKGPQALRRLIADIVRTRKATLFVLDGVRSLRDSWRNDQQVRDFYYSLSVLGEARGCTFIFTVEHPLKTMLALPEATTTDGIVSVFVKRLGSYRRRRIEVVKLRGRAHLTGSHSFDIGPRGIVIYPRLESREGETTDPPEPTAARAKFGVTELDTLLNGGVPCGSMTTIAGSTGIGKTLLCAQFCAAAAERGEATLFVSLEETPASLISRASAVGIELASHVRSGMLRIEHVVPVELDVDRWVDAVLELIDQQRLRTLVVDSLGYLVRAVADMARSETFVLALVEALRRRRVTAVFTLDVPKFAGLELDFSSMPVHVAAENLLLLRHVELTGKLHRIISILKMRASAHDGHVREFSVDSKGIHVLDPVQSAEGLLTGRAHRIGGAPAGTK